MLEKVAPKQRFQLIGEILSLFLMSGLHRRFTVNAFADNVIPTLDTAQFKIYKKNDFPIAFVSWAYLSDEIEEKYKTFNYQLKPEDFQSGKNLWFVDFIAPFGQAEMIAEDLKRNSFFDDKEAKFIRSDANGKVKKISTLRR